MASRVAVLDACVLFPEWLRDLFLRCAEAGLLRVAWTSEILEETIRNLESERGLTPDKTAKLVAAMNRAFPDASIDHFQQYVRSMTNHPKDRHVMAAAFAVARDEGAAVVVTANLKDFPRESWPHGVTVVSPDGLLCALLDDEPAVVVDVIWAHAQSRKRPPISVRELLEGLELHAPEFIQRLWPVVSVRSDPQIRQITDRFEALSEYRPVEAWVAIENRLLVDTSYEARVAQALDSREFVAVLRAVLKDAEYASKFDAYLVRRGSKLSADEVRTLSDEELHEVFRSLWNESQ